MNKEQVKSKMTLMSWEPWLYRPVAFVVVYMMIKNATRSAFGEQGIEGEFPLIVYDSHTWYHNGTSIRLATEEAAKYLKKIDIFTLTKKCEDLYKKIKKEILKLLEDTKSDPVELYKKVMDLISPLNVYIWVAHPCEVYYESIFKDKVKKFIPKAKVDKFIGDVGKPYKKNAHNFMEDDVRGGMDLRELHKKYSWMKARIKGGFAQGYSLVEMKEIQQEVLKKPAEKIEMPEIPKELEDLVVEIRELVYLRTFRTDVIYELYYLARPIFKKAQKKLGIDFIGDILPQDIVNGKVVKKRNTSQFAILKYYDDYYAFDNSVISVSKTGSKELNGIIAWKGKVKGEVKIVKNPNEIDKVKKGDILVTPMTIPAYIVAMNKAIAIITDEGGITCHAAIIAREMKKPCIIGTKIATKVLKDGDRVEVDANKGVVNILNK